MYTYFIIFGVIVYNSLDSDEENALKQNNPTIDPIKWHKKKKKQKDKSKVIMTLSLLLKICFFFLNSCITRKCSL